MEHKQSTATVLDVPSAVVWSSDERPEPLSPSRIDVRQASTLTTNAAAVGKFLLHFLEMAIAMGIGMAIFVPVKAALVGQGYIGLLERSSLDYQVWMNLFMVVPMVLWMRVRGHGWRHGAEMGAAMIVPTACVLALCSLGVTNVLPWFTTNLSGPAMFLGMLGIMVYRREMYASAYSLAWVRRVRAGHSHGSN